MKIYRKIIKIGNSKGVTFPKDCIPMDFEIGEWIEITIKKVR